MKSPVDYCSGAPSPLSKQVADETSGSRSRRAAKNLQQRRRSCFLILLSLSNLLLLSPQPVLAGYYDHQGYKPENWKKDENAGRSYFWKELDYDAMHDFVNQTDKFAILKLYGDVCAHCQEIHQAQEIAAKKIQKETDELIFGRIDVPRFGGTATLYKWFEKNFPNFDVKGERGFSFDSLSIPSVYIITKGSRWSLIAHEGNIARMEHGAIGWGHTHKQGAQKMKEWLKGHTYRTRKFGKKRSARMAAIRHQERMESIDEEVDADPDL